MNASGRLNTCKSNGNRAVAIQLLTSGRRVRNTYAIYLYLVNSSEKSELIHHSTSKRHLFEIKAPADRDERASD